MVILTSSLRTDGFLPHLRLFNSDFYFILQHFPPPTNFRRSGEKAAMRILAERVLLPDYKYCTYTPWESERRNCGLCPAHLWPRTGPRWLTGTGHLRDTQVTGTGSVLLGC